MSRCRSPSLRLLRIQLFRNTANPSSTAWNLSNIFYPKLPRWSADKFFRSNNSGRIRIKSTMSYACYDASSLYYHYLFLICKDFTLAIFIAFSLFIFLRSIYFFLPLFFSNPDDPNPPIRPDSFVIPTRRFKTVFNYLPKHASHRNQTIYTFGQVLEFYIDFTLLKHEFTSLSDTRSYKSDPIFKSIFNVDSFRPVDLLPILEKHIILIKIPASSIEKLEKSRSTF